MNTLRTLRPILRPLTHHPKPHPTPRTFTTTSPTHNLARMTLIGRLGSPPEASQTSTGGTIYRYALATSYGPRDNRETSWFNVAAFTNADASEGQQARMRDLEKGSLIYVECDSRMVNVPIPGEVEGGKTRKALNLVQRQMQVLQRPNRDTSDPANAAGNTDGAYTEAGI